MGQPGLDLAGGRPGAQPNYGAVADLEMKDGGGTRGSGDGSPPAGSRGRAPVGVWGRSPQKLTTYYENNCQKHRLLAGQSKNNEIEGFGGRPPVGGRPGTPSTLPLNPALMQRISIALSALISRATTQYRLKRASKVTKTDRQTEKLGR